MDQLLHRRQPARRRVPQGPGLPRGRRRPHPPADRRPGHQRGRRRRGQPRLEARRRGQGHAPEGLLDTYHSERHPVGARIVYNTLVQRTLYLGGPEAQPLRDLFAELVRIEDVRRHLVGLVTGLDITYGAVEGGHPLLGRRLPDQELLVGDEKTTTYELLHQGRPVLLDLHDNAALREAAAAWADRVDVVTAARPDAAAPAADLLVRPDGYIAWVGADGSTDGLTDALAQWFGEPGTAV